MKIITKKRNKIIEQEIIDYIDSELEEKYNDYNISEEALNNSIKNREVFARLCDILAKKDILTAKEITFIIRNFEDENSKLKKL